MTTGRNFSSLKGSGNIWNPTKEEDGTAREEATAADVLDGYYFDRRDGVGPHSSTIITIEKEDGEKVDVWCGTVLLDLIEKVRLGSFVRLQWLGRVLKKSASSKKPAALKDTDYFQNWDVMVDRDTPPKDIAATTAAPAATSTPAGAKAATGGNKVEEKSPSKAGDDALPF